MEYICDDSRIFSYTRVHTLMCIVNLCVRVFDLLSASVFECGRFLKINWMQNEYETNERMKHKCKHLLADYEIQLGNLEWYFGSQYVRN